MSLRQHLLPLRRKAIWGPKRAIHDVMSSVLVAIALVGATATPSGAQGRAAASPRLDDPVADRLVSGDNADPFKVIDTVKPGATSVFIQSLGVPTSTK